MMSGRKKFVRALLLGTVPTLTFSGVQAQDEDEGAFALEEITVTARKRSESLMDTPVAITAVSGKAVAQKGITGLEQLSAGVPGLQIGRAAQTSNVVIRGVGSGINKGFEQSVGMYVDGIYQPRSRQFTQSLVDLQQIEVLRGPQGVLFGKNTVAGAIKVETATPRPGDDFSGSVTVGWEPEFNGQRYTGVLSGSLSETFAARGVVRLSRSDGYVYNELYDQDTADKEDVLVRLSLAWEPSDDLSVVAKVSHVDMESLGKEATYFAQDSELPPAATVGLSTVFDPDFALAAGDAAYTSFIGNRGLDVENSKSTQASLKVEWEQENYTVTSLTGYTEFEFLQHHDVDFLAVDFIQNEDEEELEMFSQELRIATNLDGRFNIFAGAYFEKQDAHVEERTFFNGDLGVFPAPATLWLTLPTPFPLDAVNEVVMQTLFDQDSETIALFSEMTFDINDKLTFELGLRYSEDTKDVRKVTSIGTGAPGGYDLLVNPEDTAGSADVGAYLGNAAAAGGVEGMQSAFIYAALLSRFEQDVTDTRKEKHFDPSFKLRYTYSDDGMAYISYSEGYKSGGFNFSPDTAAPDGSTIPGHSFEDEGVKAWEIGVKHNFMDNRARVGLIGFQSSISDLQVTSWGGTSFVVGNAAELTVKGLELEAQYLLTEELQLSGSLAYLDHGFDSFPGAGCSTPELNLGTCQNSQGPDSGTKDLSGMRGAYAPKFSGTFSVNYNKNIGDYDLSASVDVNHKGGMYLDGDLDRNVFQDAFWKVDARLGIASIDNGWGLNVYIRNLTNKTTYTATVDAPLSAGSYIGWIEEPRVWGVQASYNF